MNLVDGSIQLRNKMSVHVPFVFSSNLSKIFRMEYYGTKEVGSASPAEPLLRPVSYFLALRDKKLTPHGHYSIPQK